MAGECQVNRSAGATILALVLLSLGCATGGPRHVATVAMLSSHSVLAATQDMEMQLVCGRPLAPVLGCVPIEQHHELARKLARAFALEAQVARTVRALPPGQPQSEDVARLTMEISGLVSEVLAAIPQSRERTGLAARLGKVAR